MHFLITNWYRFFQFRTLVGVEISARSAIVPSTEGCKRTKQERSPILLWFAFGILIDLKQSASDSQKPEPDKSYFGALLPVLPFTRSQFRLNTTSTKALTENVKYCLNTNNKKTGLPQVLSCGFKREHQIDFWV